jgi:hypothetical protein
LLAWVCSVSPRDAASKKWLRNLRLLFRIKQKTRFGGFFIASVLSNGWGAAPLLVPAASWFGIHQSIVKK